MRKTTAKDFPPYSEAKKKELAEKYTAVQMAAIEAGEAAIDPNDLAEQATFREDTMGLSYFDDLSEIHPVVDKPVRAPESNHDPNLRLKNDQELIDDLAHWVRNLPEDPSIDDWTNFQDNLRLTVGKEEAEFNPPSSLAPELPLLYDTEITPESEEKAELSLKMRRVMLQTGYSLNEIKRLRSKLLVTRRVVNQTKLGKIAKQYFLSVAGNGKGLLGFGEAKAAEPKGAREQSFLNAVRNMKPILRYENRTIFGDVRGKVAGTEIELMTRPPGMCLSLTSLPFCSCAFD